jgi:hypothetical protein
MAPSFFIQSTIDMPSSRVTMPSRLGGCSLYCLGVEGGDIDVPHF